jgi:hypothetical protein
MTFFSDAIFICLGARIERGIFLQDIIDILSSGLIASGITREKKEGGGRKR